MNMFPSLSPAWRTEGGRLEYSYQLAWVYIYDYVKKHVIENAEWIFNTDH